MPLICYVQKNFHGKSLGLIHQANGILAEYAGLNLNLTLRQLYYQFVARGVIENSFREYKKLQQLISDARLAGLIDWDSIVDRTRNLQSFPHWDSPADIIWQSSHSYREDKWATQKNHVEVWVEKDALIGVVERACELYQTPFFSCRGYTSQSEVWGAAQRLAELDKPATILHLGDHDPSGVDMSRDIQDRMELFNADNVKVKRVALTMAQIRKLNPPPNPAKITDSRAAGYIKQYGQQSWELDALDPKFMIDLIHTETRKLIEMNEWEKACAAEAEGKESLAELSRAYEVAARFVKSPGAIARFEEWEEDEQEQQEED